MKSDECTMKEPERAYSRRLARRSSPHPVCIRLFHSACFILHSSFCIPARQWCFILWLAVGISAPAWGSEKLEFLRVSNDGRGFVTVDTQTPFVPWGFNYDHDAAGRLIEDYWDAEWPTVEADFAEMRALGANVVRIHLQVAKFMTDAETPHEKSLEKLRALATVAERERLYLDVTGLGCYHKQDVPAWYDALEESARWDVQARFWKAVASTLKDSPAVFCYDLMNEPVSPAGSRKDRDWLGPAFGGKHFVQRISLDQAQRPRPEIAQAWIHKLVTAIHEVDQRHLITVGLVDWSLDRPGLTSGFVPKAVADELDFLCVHLYHKSGKLPEDLETLRGFAIGKPVVIEEMFPLGCKPTELAAFVLASRESATGWISFYWGRTPEEMRDTKSFGEALLRQWLEEFVKLTPQLMPARKSD